MTQGLFELDLFLIHPGAGTVVDVLVVRFSQIALLGDGESQEEEEGG